MSVSKASKFFSLTLFITSIWLFWVLRIDDFPESLHIPIYAFPLILAVLFGLVAVGNVTYHMLVFKECPKAYEELLKDIKEAKTELAKKGLKLKTK